MGIVEAARGVLWARRNSPDQPVYGVALGHERHQPDELLEQAIAADRAGFDAIACSDHLTPWWPAGDPAPNSSGNAWVWLGAVGNATTQASLGTAVTGAIHRYNPVVLAQQVATLEILNPGRAFLGVGSSEAMNEVPAGMDWPDVAEQQERMAEQLQIITALLAGETVNFDGRYFKAKGARLYALPERRVPVYVSAFGENAARIAARYGDGLWTLADPMQAPKVIGAYRTEREALGKDPGEIVLQALFSWAEDDDTAFENAKQWKATLPPELYTDPIVEPAEIKAKGDEVSDSKFKAGTIIGSDPKAHVRKIKAIQQLGATAVVLMNCSGENSLEALRVYGEEVLPELRD
jgi:coenzyme F420-dependent glucose-6-phosphate dehydrogenase